jgi:hypothetical protein
MRKVIEDAITEAKLLDMPRITLSLKDAESLYWQLEKDDVAKTDLSEALQSQKEENHKLRKANFSLNPWA